MTCVVNYYLRYFKIACNIPNNNFLVSSWTSLLWLNKDSSYTSLALTQILIYTDLSAYRLVWVSYVPAVHPTDPTCNIVEYPPSPSVELVGSSMLFLIKQKYLDWLSIIVVFFGHKSCRPDFVS